MASQQNWSGVRFAFWIALPCLFPNHHNVKEGVIRVQCFALFGKPQAGDLCVSCNWWLNYCCVTVFVIARVA
jgi:hypothetical protein